MRKVLSVILAVMMLVGILPTAVVAVTYDATVSTVSGSSSVNRGASFTFSLYVEGTFDGFSIDIPKEGSGYAITSAVATTAAQNGVAKVNADDKGTYYRISTLPGWEQTDSEGILVATFTATASQTFKGTPSLDVSNAEVSDITGDLANTLVSEGTFELVCVTHSYGDWEKDDETNHKKVCEYCADKSTQPHSWDDGVIDPDSTHTEKGTKTYTCTVCGETKTEDVPEKPEHDFNYSKLDEDKHTVTCECGYTDTEPHNWNSGEVTLEAKCDAFGEKTFTCLDCGEIKTQQLPKLPHNYGEWLEHDGAQHKRQCSSCLEFEYKTHSWDEGEVTTDPTCCDEGVKTYTCTDCGETKTEDVPATGEHVYGDWQKHDEDQHKRECLTTDCGDIDYADHNWDEGVLDPLPSCSEPGTRNYTCLDCGETKSETVLPTGEHVYGDWQKHDEDQHKRSCGCGDTQYANHNWDNGEVTTDPTCCDEGVKTYTCTDCGETKTEPVPATNEHTYGEWQKDTAEQHVRVCTTPNCGDTQYANHNWDNGEVTTDPTCCDEGVKTYTCTDCGETKTEPVPATNEHIYGEWMEYTPTQHQRICTNVLCGKYDYAPHTWDDGEVTTPPTCTDTGIRTFTCDDCGETKTADEPATGVHTYKVQINLTLNGVATTATKLLSGKATDTLDVNDVITWASSALTLTGNPVRTELIGVDDIKPFGEGVPSTVEDPCDYTRIDTVDVVTYYNVTYTDGVTENVFADNVTEVRYGEQTPTVSDPTWSGHVFTGWDKTIAATVTETVTYTATWDEDANGNGTPDSEEPKYFVSYFDGVNSTPIFGAFVLVGMPTPTIADPVREGYAFMGWDMEIPATVTGDVAYIATWLDINDAFWTDDNPYYTYEDAIKDVTAGSVFEAPANMSASETLDVIKELGERLKELAEDNNVEQNELGVSAVISTDDVSITLDSSAVAALAENASQSDELNVSLNEVDEDDSRLEDVKLPNGAKVYEIVLTDENGNEIDISNDSNEGTATITLSYTEQGSAQICYVGADGKATKLKTTTDKNAQTASANVTEFGIFYVVKVSNTNANTITGIVYVNENYHALLVNGKLVMVPHNDNGTGYCDGCHAEIIPEVED